MGEVRRLVVELDLGDGWNDRRNQSFHRVVALDDRGWASSIGIASSEPISDADRAELDIWAGQTAAALEFTARMVVGPDEPPEGMSYEEAADDHWDYLVGLLAERGVSIDAATLRLLPMDVDLSERVLARLPGA